jgi:hypothetical protein
MLQLLFAAISLMMSQQAFTTKLPLAGITSHRFLHSSTNTSDDSFTTLLWAQFSIRVFGDQLEMVDLLVFFLDIDW